MKPIRSGLYWVKTDLDYDWFNAIAFIGGSVPFLHVEYIFYWMEGLLCEADDLISEIVEWGGKIRELEKV